MNKGAGERLKQLPSVFTMADLCRVSSVTPKDASVMLHRWRAREMVRSFSPKSGVYFNLVNSPQWEDNLETALVRVLPSSVRVGEDVLFQAGWITQKSRSPAYAVWEEGRHVALEDILLVDRPSSWYQLLHTLKGLTSQRPVPSVSPSFALADALIFGNGELWVPAPDDLYIDDVSGGDFVKALHALISLKQVSFIQNDVDQSGTLQEVYERAYHLYRSPPPAHQRRHRSCP